MAIPIKKLVRQAIKRKLQSVTQEMVADYSQKISNVLIESRLFQEARTVGLFLPMEREVDLVRVARACFEAVPRKRLFVPVVPPRGVVPPPPGRRVPPLLFVEVVSGEDLDMCLGHRTALGIPEPPLETVPGRAVWEYGECVRGVVERVGAWVGRVCVSGAGPWVGRVDLLAVPGLVFDVRGHRLGRGAGCYDGVLGEVRGHVCGDVGVSVCGGGVGGGVGAVVGVCFPEQVVGNGRGVCLDVCVEGGDVGCVGVMFDPPDVHVEYVVDGVGGCGPGGVRLCVTSVPSCPHDAVVDGVLAGGVWEKFPSTCGASQ